MNEYTYVALRQVPELKETAAAWFHFKWGVPQEAYLECMEAYLKNETEYGWYLCLDNGRIIGGLRFLYKGIIINHNKKPSQPTLKRRFFKKKAAFFHGPVWERSGADFILKRKGEFF